MSILPAALAIVLAVSPVQVAVAAVDGTNELATGASSGPASPPTPSSPAPAPPPSSNSEVGNPQAPKAAQLAETKQEMPLQPGSTVQQKGTNSGAEKITFIPGLRFQGRYTYDTDSGKHNLFIQRLRLKSRGEVFGVARYLVEVKIDNLGRLETDPRAELENAWIERTVTPNFALRLGLYDVPFSRNALTSDSKLLLMDRSLIKDAITGLGLADNTIGLLGHGRPFKGRFEYAMGVSNNLQFKGFGATATKRSNHLMPAGRIAFNLLDPAPKGGYADYQSSYLGRGKKLSIGANSVYLRGAHDGATEFNILGWGADLFCSAGPFTFETEYDRFKKDFTGAKPNLQGAGWYVQGGYLVARRVELTARQQKLDPDMRIAGNGLSWTSAGFNVYMRGHNLKMQFDYTFRRGPGQAIKTDVPQIQLQADF
jgi:hypothetical protein